MVFPNLTPLCVCLLPHALLCRVVSKISDLLGLFEFFPLKLPFCQDLLQWHVFFHSNPNLGLFCGMESVWQSYIAKGFLMEGIHILQASRRPCLTFPGLSLATGVVEGVKFFFELVSFYIGVFHSHVPPGQGFLHSKGFFSAFTVLWAFLRVTLPSCLIFGSVLDLSFQLNLIFSNALSDQTECFIAITLVIRVSVFQALVLHPELSLFAISL